MEDVMSQWRLGAVGLAAVLVLSAAGCGGTNDELAGQVATEFQSLLPVTDEQAQCLGREMVNLYGEDEMQRFVDDPEGFLPTEEASAEDTAAVLDTCEIDPVELVRDTTLDELPEVDFDVEVEPGGTQVDGNDTVVD